MHYNRHRYYDTCLGAYISQDPVRLTGGLNLYQYTAYPTDITDPLGLSGEPSVLGALTDKEFWKGYGSAVLDVGTATGKMLLGELGMYSGFMMSKLPGGKITGGYLMADGVSTYPGGMCEISQVFHGKDVNCVGGGDALGQAYRDASEFYTGDPGYGDLARATVGISSVVRANTIPINHGIFQGKSGYHYYTIVPAYKSSNRFLIGSDIASIVMSANSMCEK